MNLWNGLFVEFYEIMFPRGTLRREHRSSLELNQILVPTPREEHYHGSLTASFRPPSTQTCLSAFESLKKQTGDFRRVEDVPMI